MRDLNEETRKEFIEYVEEYGVKIKHIAEKIDIPFSTLSKWKRENLNFRIDKLVKIKKYMSDNKKK